MDNQFFFFLLLLLVGCGGSTPAPARLQQHNLRGETMGTYYSIKYNGLAGPQYQAGIDSLFKELDLALSTYVPHSQISQFNQKDSLRLTAPSYFNEVFDKAKEVHMKSAGAFDPTIMPLVNFWGFGYTEKTRTAKDMEKADSLLALVGFDKVVGTKGAARLYTKKTPGIQLDFSALGKGYGVDIIGEFLEAKGIKDYLVEIGGEVRARGKSRPDKEWAVGINSPEEGAALTDIHTVVLLKEASLASSGNYRNYYEVEGQKFAHTINPKTGRPELNNLLGASIIAKDCMTADAYATACMVLGPKRAFELIEKEDELEGYLIFSDDSGVIQTRYSEGMKHYLVDVE